MGCASSHSMRDGVAKGRKKRKSSGIAMVAVFVSSLRVPVSVDLIGPMRGLVSRSLLDSVSALRTRIGLLADQRNLTVLPELRHTLEEYLPILLGLTKKDDLVEFKWRNLQGDKQETSFTSTWYEVLSVIHLMAMLALLEANKLLLPTDSPQLCVEASEDSKKNAIDLLLKASGYLDYCVHHIMDHLSLQIRYSLPCDMQEGALEAISIQALGQVLEIQLGLAAECEKASLSVIRRLACEELSYFAQAHYCLLGCATDDYYGKKHQLFIKWKYLEAKAAAYYYHGLLLDKETRPKDHIDALNCFVASDKLLIESKKSCLHFCLAAPVTRVPPIRGLMKHLHKVTAEVASMKFQAYAYLLEQEMDLQSIPELPVFSLSLNPEDYNLPDIDPSWDTDEDDDERRQPVLQRLKDHLNDDDE
ncbi:Endosomal targeting BRO1-like domain-containing protein [Zostera marina]|uniref:Endosomal targeting BRO1-like domain-containing protein n=1 Tax=Zostera marina TaxID=29655 RepID=A0A0K9NMB3_ZOSMR|nr:Endosomal targeting BRO1-like domain-containing protein [Zostera marina]